MARFIVQASSPSLTALVDALNSQLATLLAHKIKQAQLLIVSGGQTIQVSHRAIIELETGGAAMASPWVVEGFSGPQLASVSQDFDDYVAANPALFISPPIMDFMADVAENRVSDMFIIGITSADAVPAAANWQIGGAAGGGGGGPAPAATVTDETSYGLAPAVGIGLAYARDDHSHGSPPDGLAGDVGGTFGANSIGAIQTVPVNSVAGLGPIQVDALTAGIKSGPYVEFFTDVATAAVNTAGSPRIIGSFICITADANPADNGWWQMLIDSEPLGFPSGYALVGAAPSYLSAVPAGRSIYVDATLGNDGTAVINDVAHPFSSLDAAIAAQVAGDCLIIRPGSYTCATAMNHAGGSSVVCLGLVDITAAGLALDVATATSVSFVGPQTSIIGRIAAAPGGSVLVVRALVISGTGDAANPGMALAGNFVSIEASDYTFTGDRAGDTAIKIGVMDAAASSIGLRFQTITTNAAGVLEGTSALGAVSLQVGRVVDSFGASAFFSANVVDFNLDMAVGAIENRTTFVFGHTGAKYLTGFIGTWLSALAGEIQLALDAGSQVNFNAGDNCPGLLITSGAAVSTGIVRAGRVVGPIRLDGTGTNVSVECQSISVGNGKKAIYVADGNHVVSVLGNIDTTDTVAVDVNGGSLQLKAGNITSGGESCISTNAIISVVCAKIDAGAGTVNALYCNGTLRVECWSINHAGSSVAILCDSGFLTIACSEDIISAASGVLVGGSTSTITLAARDISGFPTTQGVDYTVSLADDASLTLTCRDILATKTGGGSALKVNTTGSAKVTARDIGQPSSTFGRCIYVVAGSLDLTARDLLAPSATGALQISQTVAYDSVIRLRNGGVAGVSISSAGNVYLYADYLPGLEAYAGTTFVEANRIGTLYSTSGSGVVSTLFLTAQQMGRITMGANNDASSVWTIRCPLITGIAASTSVEALGPGTLILHGGIVRTLAYNPLAISSIAGACEFHNIKFDATGFNYPAAFIDATTRFMNCVFIGGGSATESIGTGSTPAIKFLTPCSANLPLAAGITSEVFALTVDANVD
jgi:hypothetical protein